MTRVETRSSVFISAVRRLPAAATTGTAAANKELPFSGLYLPFVLAIALALMGAGIAARRWATLREGGAA